MNRRAVFTLPLKRGLGRNTFGAKLRVFLDLATSRDVLNVWFLRSSRRYFFFEEDFLRGTLAPSFRASDNPIAIACFLLVTFLPDLPLFNVPSFRSCIALLTLLAAFLPYLAIIFSISFESSVRLFVAIEMPTHQRL